MTGTFRAQTWLYLRLDFAVASASGSREEGRGQEGSGQTRGPRSVASWSLNEYMGQGHHLEVIKTGFREVDT